MSKHFSIFQTDSQYQSNKDNLDYPHVSLIDTTGDLHYAVFKGKNLYNANFADIAIAEISSGQLFYLEESEYNTTEYPLASYKPIAVCIRPSSENTHNEAIFMSLCVIDINSEERFYSFGNQYNWGQNGVNLTSININSTSASSKEINTALKNSNFLRDEWKDEGPVNSSASGYSAPFEISWKYSTPGTKPGDWMLPSYYDVNYIDGRMKQLYSSINNTVKKMNSSYSILGNYFYLAYSNNNLYCCGVRIANGSSQNSWGLWDGIRRNSTNNSCMVRPVFAAGIEEL